MIASIAYSELAQTVFSNGILILFDLWLAWKITGALMKFIERRKQ
jgi:hypothetical protein